MNVKEMAIKKGFEVKERKDGRIAIKEKGAEMGIVINNLETTEEEFKEFEEEIKKIERENMINKVNSVMNKETIYENLKMCVANDLSKYEEEEDKVITEEFGEKTKIYYRFMIPELEDEIKGTPSVVITEEFKEKMGLNIDEMYKKAEEKMEKEISVKTMFETLTELINIQLEENEENDIMYVVTNKSKHMGSGYLASPRLMYKILSKIRYKLAKQGMMVKLDELIIMPSSIHEFLVIPEEKLPIEQAAEMVKEVNQSQVEEKERLSDRVYRYTFTSEDSCYIKEYDQNGNFKIFEL